MATGSPIVGEKSPGHQRMMSLGGVAPSSMGYAGGPSGGGELGFNREHGKISCLRTASITHGSELSFIEFLDLFKSFRCSFFTYFAITWNLTGVTAYQNETTIGHRSSSSREDSHSQRLEFQFDTTASGLISEP